MHGLIARKQIRVSGIVQGIGFRPFVYRLAQRLHLKGHVLNTSEGVLVEVEGSPQALDTFLEGLARDHPPLALIESIVVTELTPGGDSHFTIAASTCAPAQFVLISPDLASCEDCLRDTTDPANRRFGYAFTNCTNCGPRYTIIRDIPYDRPATTMARFQMCPACRAEYDDPGDRRFHAQPNACPDCGPRLSLMSDTEAPDVLSQARSLLADGKILAIKGLGGFHLACDAENDSAVRLLRQRKRRSDKPFGVMAANLYVIAQFCQLSDPDRRTLLSVERPIVILPCRAGSSISPGVAPGNATVGMMLPYTPLHHLLFTDAAYRLLVMTSGNLSEEPIVIHNEGARERLGPIADCMVLHNRDIYMRADDSVVRNFEAQTRVLRRSRGYAPYPIDIGTEGTEVLACGGELKNTFCLTKGRYALLSQHIGDLENYETLMFYRETLEQMKKLFRVNPRVVAYDLHPGYLSTKFALEQKAECMIGVQHHHAHVAACMAENHLREKVIGVAFDGTGYGTDGQIWGGEFLVADLAGFERRAHLRYVSLAGGDRAVREPWRAALSYLLDALGELNTCEDLPLLRDIPANKMQFVQAMLKNRVNTIQTSSCGRLFDAVASIVGLRHKVTFEGQAAIELETAAVEGTDEHYPFEVDHSEPWQVDMRASICAIVADVKLGEPVAVISARFHNTVAAAIVEVSKRLRRAERLRQVCLSGGAFQNIYLLNRTLGGLRRCGFEVFLHAKVPPNDGGISLGQAAIARSQSL